MRLLIIVLVVLFLLLQYTLWFQQGGITNTLRLKHALSVQTKENQNLYKKNQKLLSEVYQLKHDRNAVETLAREQIGMVKKGEIYYQFVETNKKSSMKK